MTPETPVFVARPPLTVSTGELEALAGVSAATLNYWVHRGVLNPEKDTQGSGDPRRWSKTDFAGVRVLFHCRDLGLNRMLQANMVGFMAAGGWPLAPGLLVVSARAIGYVPPQLPLALPPGDAAVVVIDLQQISREVESAWPTHSRKGR